MSDNLTEWEAQYEVAKTSNDLGLRFQKVLRAAHEKTGLGAVVLIDEYDKPILDVIELDYQVEHLGKMISLEEKHRNIMKSFYTTFKGADADLRLCSSQVLRNSRKSACSVDLTNLLTSA